LQYREIGKTGIRASVVGFGAWAMGGGGFWDGVDDDEEAVSAVRFALDHGINLIDTAPGYGEGKSERLVGEAISGYDRSKLVISTKCGIVWWGDEGGYMHTMNGLRYYRNLEPKSIRYEVEQSLKRLGVEYIDVLFTHWPSLESFPTPIQKTMECLLELKEKGWIKAIGASNVSPDQIKEYMDAGQLDATQPPYSMLNRGIEGEYVEYCMQNGISIFAYSPLEQGLLTGKITMDYQPKSGTYRADYLSWYQAQNRKQVIDMLSSWHDLTQKYEASIAQLVIAWTVAQPGITHTLCGARKRKHVEENARGGSLSLAQDDLARMRRDVEGLQLA